jgi:hypothetical protein
MLTEFYRTCLQSQLSQSQLHTLEILVWLLHQQKQVRVERLAACLPLPILFESRRRHLQRFLILPQLSVVLLWLPLIQGIIKAQIKSGNQMIIAVDRTQWRTNNLLMVSVIWAHRAWPFYWQFMPKSGSSNLEQQQAILRPVLRLLKSYQVVVVGDREFHSVKLATWLQEQKVNFALRQKKTTYIKQTGRDYQQLSTIGLAPGIKLFFPGVAVTKTKGFAEFNLAAYWQKKSKNKALDSGWYILTNLNSLDAALHAYKARSGIEAMFKDCTSGGYNLEECKASQERLNRIVLLIAIAYTCVGLAGQKIKRQGQHKYVNRLKEPRRVEPRHSNFWLGLYGQTWIAGVEFCRDLVQELMRIRPNKLPFYQRGLNAMNLIQQAF